MMQKLQVVKREAFFFVRTWVLQELLYIIRPNTLTQLLYKKLPILKLFYSFTPYQLCVKLANLLLCHITLVWFPDGDPLWVETYRNIHYSIIIHVSYLRKNLVYFVGRFANWLWTRHVMDGIKFPKNILRDSNEIYACY